MLSVNFDQLYRSPINYVPGYKSSGIIANTEGYNHSTLPDFVSGCEERLEVSDDFLVLDVGSEGRRVKALGNVGAISGVEEGLKVADYFFVFDVGGE